MKKTLGKSDVGLILSGKTYKNTQQFSSYWFCLTAQDGMKKGREKNKSGLRKAKQSKSSIYKVSSLNGNGDFTDKRLDWKG